MASQVDIANMALAHIGMRAITSISADEPSAEACNEFWIPSRDEVLSEHRWPFANTQAALAELTDQVIGWDFTYAYPSAAARVFYVYDEGSVDRKEENDFEVVYIPSGNKRVICCDLEDAYCEYTYKVSDTTLWDAKFVMAFSYRLASAICHTLTGDADKALKLMDVYNGLMSDAKRLSYQEKVKKPNQKNTYYDAR